MLLNPFANLHEVKVGRVIGVQKGQGTVALGKPPQPPQAAQRWCNLETGVLTSSLPLSLIGQGREQSQTNCVKGKHVEQKTQADILIRDTFESVDVLFK